MAGDAKMRPTRDGDEGAAGTDGKAAPRKRVDEPPDAGPPFSRKVR